MAAALAIGTGAAYLGDEAVDRTVRRRTAAGDRRSGYAAGYRGAAGRRLQPERFVELRVGHQARHPHPYAGRHRGHRRTADLRAAGRQATLIENWDVLGLRATGSIDYTDRQRVRPRTLHAFRGHGSRRSAAVRCTRLGIVGFAVMCHSGWACGIGRRLLDELARKVRRESAGPARWRTARRSTNSTPKPRRPIERRARWWTRRGGSVNESLDRRRGRSTTRQQTLVRLAMAHITWSCHEVARIRLQLGWHHRAARRHDPAAVPRHARRHAAHHVGASRLPQRRPRAGRPRHRKKWVFLDLVNEA